MILVDECRYIPAQSARDRVYSERYWCHMTSDVSADELHEFAVSIGLMREWFADHPTHPHYDLTQAKRKKAVRLGAVEVTSTELVKRCYVRRQV